MSLLIPWTTTTESVGVGCPWITCNVHKVNNNPLKKLIRPFHCFCPDEFHLFVHTTFLELKPPDNLGTDAKKFLNKERTLKFVEWNFAAIHDPQSKVSLSGVFWLAVVLSLKETCNWGGITPVVLYNQCIYFLSHSWVRWCSLKWSEVKPCVMNKCMLLQSLLVLSFPSQLFHALLRCFCEEVLIFLCFCWFNKHEAPFMTKNFDGEDGTGATGINDLTLIG